MDSCSFLRSVSFPSSLSASDSPSSAAPDWSALCRMAGKPDRDRIEALRTPAVRIGQMNELLTEAKSLHEVCVEGLWRLTGSQII
jgi:hypothetical protein